MFSSLRSRWLYHRRARVYDASKMVEWVDATMYDSEKTVDRYDTVNANLSTFNSAMELEFLDMIDALDIRSVLDVGCGAGAFYHLVSSVRPGIRYFGYDLSAAQIARAKLRFGEYFAVRDIATIEQSEFSRYDAIHAYSVFSFMSVPDQLRTIGRMLNSGAKVLLDTGVTIPDVRYAPQSCFKDFSGAQPDEGTGHTVTFTPATYGNTRALNNSGRAGSALADKRAIKARRTASDRSVPFQPRLPYFMARIAPKEWTPTRDYADIPKDALQAEIRAMLSPAGSR